MAETRTVNLEIKDNVKSLKTQYKEAVQEVQRLADAYGATSTEAANAAKNAAQLKDRIEESKSLTDAFNPDAKFTALSGSIGGVLNGFQAYEGAMGLIGVESEELQKTLLKVQSAMALSQGIQGALEAKDAFVNLGAVVKDTFTKMTLASKAFTITGIGLAITGVAYLMGAFDDATKSVKNYASAQKTSNEIQQQAIEDSAKELSALNKLQTQINDETLTREEKNKAVKKLQDVYPDLLKNVNAEKLSINELNKAVALNIKLAESRARVNAGEALRASKYQAILTDEIEVQKTLVEIEKIKSLQAGDDYKQRQIAMATRFDLKPAQDRIALAKEEIKQIDGITKADEALIAQVEKQTKVYETETPKVIKQVKERADYSIQTEKERIDAMEDGMEKRLALLNFEEKGELAQIDKKGKKAGELTTAIETRYEKERNKVKEEFRIRRDRDEDVSLEKRPVKRLEIGKQEIDAEAFVQSEILRLQQEAGEKSVADAKAVAEQKAAIQQQGLDTALQGVQLIKGLFEKSKGVQKAAVIAESAIGIAKMIIANKLANAGALATPQAIATSGAAAAPVIALNNISTGIGIAANIAATAKALKSLGGGSAPNAPADGGGGGGGGGASTTPQFNTIGSSGVNQLAQLQQQPVQAYVVSGDVTSAQSLDRNRIQNATL
jgi:hypothetical protein